ncbi:MAG: nucleotidyltransferase domain-containing protein [Phycisphaerae bacterium]|nr:nucleotidyltransferase domain-containing protein [Phycisphaerae bacterium]
MSEHEVTIEPRVHDAARRHPYRLLFATVSGAHLYGFASPDSDWDLRGVHVLPIDRVVRLRVDDETVQVDANDGAFELDLVTHDVRKFISLMLKRNGYVLEQLYSPIVVMTTPQHDELRALGEGCITSNHAHHYLGFAETQWSLFRKEAAPRVKPLLYTYRVLLTGIHLMQTGRVEANLVTLNEEFRLPQIAELVRQKREGREKGTLKEADLAFHEREYHRLREELEQARDRSRLPAEPSTREALDDFLVRVRCG